MAHIHIEEWRRRLNLARDAQRAALPPQPPRLDRNLWQFSRHPWVHGLDLAAKSYAIGLERPLLARLREDEQFRTTIIEANPALNLSELIVEPELPLDVYDAIKLSTLSYDPSTPSAALLAQYKPSGVRQSTVLDIAFHDGTRLIESWSAAGPAAPLILHEVLLNFMLPTFPDRGTVEIGGWNTVSLTNIGVPTVERFPALQHYILAGSASINVRIDYNALGNSFGGRFSIITERLLRVT